MKIKKLPEHPSIYEYGAALRAFNEFLNEYLRKHKIKTIKKTGLFNEVIESIFDK